MIILSRDRPEESWGVIARYEISTVISSKGTNKELETEQITNKRIIVNNAKTGKMRKNWHNQNLRT